MRHIPVDGITFSELQSHLAISKKGLSTWLKRLGGWGYLEIRDLDATGATKRAGPGTIILPTAEGKRAMDVWPTLMPTIEARWRERFGDQTIDSLQDGLKTVAGQLDPAVPAHFPVLEYEDQKSRAARIRLPVRDYLLPELLAKLLLCFEAEFDSQSLAPLAVCANVLRVTPDPGIRVRDLPRLACLSVDGVNDALRQLAWQRLGDVGADPCGSRLKYLTLTAKARLARERYLPLAGTIEKEWERRFGQETVNQLRRSLESIVQSREGMASSLLCALAPYPDGWRARLPPLNGLPHFPMESHRGGFPDGS